MLAEADAFVTRVHAETVEAFLATEHIEQSDVDIVGFHGQTVLHRPAARLTVQIGNGERWPRGSSCRSLMISGRLMWPPAGRARRWCRCSIRRWRVT